MKRFSALSSLQLRYLLKRLCRKIPTFVIAIDQLRYIKEDTFAVVVNNETSDLPGMHWIALFKSSRTSDLEVLDSYAFPLNFYGSRIQRLANRMKVGIKKNNFKIQTDNSMMCGYISLYFLILRQKGCSMSQILKKISSTNFRKNQKLVKDSFRHIDYPKLSHCLRKCFDECKMKKNDFSSVCIQANRKCTKL